MSLRRLLRVFVATAVPFGLVQGVAAALLGGGSLVTVSSRPRVRMTLVDYGINGRNVRAIAAELRSAGAQPPTGAGD